MITFNNNELQTVHTTIKDTIESRLAKLDAISKDIKTLETILARAGISFIFKYLFCTNSTQEFDGVVHHVTETCYYLTWDTDQQRLLYEVEETRSEYFEDHVSSNQNVILSKPLHDTKTHVRLQVQDELQHFYTQLIECLNSGCLVDKVTRNSPNLKSKASDLLDEEIPF